MSGAAQIGQLFVTNAGYFGNTVTAAEFLTPSDRRLKENIFKVVNATSTLQELEGVRFRWITSQKPDIGLIAQNVKAVLPEAVSSNEQTERLLVS